MRALVALLFLFLLAACAARGPAPPAVGVEAAGPDTLRPAARPEGGAELQAAALRPPPGRTADAMDTTTEAERAAATAPAAAGGRSLGTTIASLGDPASAGFWMETPLVTSVSPGRVSHASGVSVAVELRPSGGATGSGSRLSLPAFRALGLPVTGLPELAVTLD